LKNTTGNRKNLKKKKKIHLKKYLKKKNILENIFSLWKKPNPPPQPSTRLKLKILF
jgi:hypothetical protein